MSDLRLYSVNWRDGMLLGETHLRHTEAYLETLSRQFGMPLGDHWGLLPQPGTNEPSLRLEVGTVTGRLTVTLRRCRAITSLGHLIAIDDTHDAPLVADYDLGDEESVPIWLAIDPRRKAEVGEPNPDEELPRKPYQTPVYDLLIGDDPGRPSGELIPLGRVTLGADGAQLSAVDIPPAVTLSAEANLSQIATDLRNRVDNLLSLALRAYSAVTQAGALSNESTALQSDFRETIAQIAYHLSATIDQIIVGRNAVHPMTLVVTCKSLFRVFSSLFSLRPGLRDYLNERVFTKELGSDIGRFQSEIDSFLLGEYDHTRLGEQITTIRSILGSLRAVMGHVAQVKREQLGEQAVATDTLTYSGRTYRQLSYANVSVEQVGDLTYLMLTIAQPLPISDMVVLMGKELFSGGAWSSMQVRLGLNDARGLGETDPVTVDQVAFGNKVALRPEDMLKVASVNQVTLIFRGAGDTSALNRMTKNDLIAYSM